MAIQITRQPDKITWSRNPILFEFSTDQVVQDPGRPLIFKLDFTALENEHIEVIQTPSGTSYVYADWEFNISIKDSTLYISCEYGDPVDKYKIPHRISPSETKIEWLQRVRLALLEAYNLGSLFNIIVDQQTIVFTSKKNDSSLTVSLDSDDVVHPILTINQTAVDISYTPNLKLFVELFSYDLEGNEKSVVSAALAPDLNGRAFWDFSNTLTSFILEDGRDRPSLYDIDIEKGKVVRSYFLLITELYGEPQLARGSKRSHIFVTIYGGLPKNLIGTSLVDFLTGESEDRTNFLTTSRVKKVKLDQPQWLSWFNITSAVEQLKVNVELKYNDGSYYNFTAHTFESVAQYDKIIFPIGLDQIGANSLYPELTVISYVVSLYTENSRISEALTYQVDNRYHPYKRFFLFQNSLGSFETFFTYGKKSNSLDFEKDSARTIQIKDFVLENGENVDLDTTGQEKEKINTGYRSKAEIKAMRDFYLSKEKLTYVENQWWPINLSSSSIDEFQDGNGLFAQSFEISGQHLQEMFYE